jgi:hypothetical protein
LLSQPHAANSVRWHNGERRYAAEQDVEAMRCTMVATGRGASGAWITMRYPATPRPTGRYRVAQQTCNARQSVSLPMSPAKRRGWVGQKSSGWVQQEMLRIREDSVTFVATPHFPRCSATRYGGEIHRDISPYATSTRVARPPARRRHAECIDTPAEDAEGAVNSVSLSIISIISSTVSEQ